MTDLAANIQSAIKALEAGNPEPAFDAIFSIMDRNGAIDLVEHLLLSRLAIMVGTAIASGKTLEDMKTAAEIIALLRGTKTA